jgi:PAS domain S-box-containing protein
MNAAGSRIPGNPSSLIEASSQNVIHDEGGIRNGQHANGAGHGTLIEQAEIRTDQANTRTDEAEARTTEANTRTDQANTRTDEANLRTEQSEARGVLAEARSVEALKASGLLYRRLFETAQDGILILDADTGQVVDANPFMKDLLGYSQEEFLGRKLWEIGPFKGEAASKITFAELQHKDRIRYEGLPLETKDGRRVEVEFISNAYLVDQKRLIQCNIRDITERKRADARFRRLVDSNAQGVMFWNTKGEITEANNAFLELVRYTREDLVAGCINWLARTPPEYASLDRRALEQIAATGACKPYEKEFICKDGSRVPILIGAASFEDSPEEGVCFFVDLTERKKLEHQFLRAQRMESIGTLAGGIAHDLNNILAPILMSIELLKASATDPEAKTILETIEVSSRRGADIVRQVLSFARGLEGERVEIQPKHVVQDLENIIKDTFPKDIRLKFSIPEDTWTILGDPTQVHQILLNLSVNARDAMPNGGALTIGVVNCVLDDQYASMHIQAKPGRYVNISVTDSGAGMTQVIIDKIFEPFFTTKELNKGTGLGLSTVMAIVKSHDGFINVYSEPGKGTTMKVYLPAMENCSQARKDETQAIDLPRGNGETVLLVDDEASIIVITKRTLQAFGYRVLTATDGAEALAIYAEHKSDIAVVLTDMAMPILDGPASIRALMRINPAVKIVAASGLNSNGGVAKVSGASIKYFLMKPYTAATLLKTLRAILDEA